MGACWTSRGPRMLFILAPEEAARPQMIQVPRARHAFLKDTGNTSA